MGAARYLGRAGGLAAAAGLGVTIMFSAPLAGADTAESSTSEPAAPASAPPPSSTPPQTSAQADDAQDDDDVDEDDGDDGDGDVSNEDLDDEAAGGDAQNDLDGESAGEDLEAGDDNAAEEASADRMSLAADDTADAPQADPEPAAPAHKITYDADIEVDDNVITGTNERHRPPGRGRRL